MEDGRLPKDILYGQLATGTRRVGRPSLRFKDVCKRDMKACGISPDSWEVQAEDRGTWRLAVSKSIAVADMRRDQLAAEKRERKKSSAATQVTQTS